MAITAQYAATPKTVCFSLSAANTNLDGTGTLVTAYTAGANGSIVDCINLKATGINTDGMIRIFVSDGTNTNVLTEVIVPATTPSVNAGAVVQSWETIVDLMGLVLAPTYTLKVATNNAEAFRGITFGGDL